MGAATPELVARESDLQTIDSVELFRNGVYWWTSSACSGDVVSRGGAAYQGYSDARLQATAATLFGAPAKLPGGFQAGDALDLGISIKDSASALKGVLVPDCGYGAYLVRDDDAFYYAYQRRLHRKFLTAGAQAETLQFKVALERLPIAADGVLQVTENEVWFYAADLARNTLTVQRSFKSTTRDFGEPRDVAAVPGVSLRKFAFADIRAEDGSYLTTELLMLAPEGRLWRAAVFGNNPSLVRSGVSDFALRNEIYRTAGPLGSTVRHRATTLYLALGNPLTLAGASRLVGLDLTPGGRSEFVEFPATAGTRVTSVAVDSRHVFLTRTADSGAANSELFRRRAPTEPTLVNPGDPDYETIGVSREYRSLRSTGRLVYFAHANTVQRLSVEAPRIDLDFEAFGVEATQAIQDLNNSVPLAAAKRVFVCGYARVGTNGTGLATFGVPAELRVYHSPKVPIGQAPFEEVAGSPFEPSAVPQVTRVDAWTPVRTNANATFLFEVPAAVMREGQVRFEFNLNPGRTVPETGLNPLANNTAAGTVRVVSARVVPLTMVPVQFNGGFYNRNDPGERFWEIIARAETQMPNPGFRLGFRRPGVSRMVFTLGGFERRSFDFPANDAAALDAVDFTRVLDGNPLGGPYVGMVPKEASPWNGLGRRPGQALVARMGTNGYSSAAWNSFHGGFNLAHEFGHNSGLRHILNDLTCGSQIPTSSDGIFDPLPGNASGCTLGATNLEDPATAVGYDPLTGSIVLPAANGDLMSYANQVWISATNWTRLIETYSATPPAPQGSVALHGPTTGPVLILQGTVDLEANTASLSPGYTLPAEELAPEILEELTELPANLPPNYPWRLQAVGDGGGILTDDPAPLRLNDGGDAPSATFVRALDLPSGTRAVRLVHQSAVLVELPVSARPPEIALQVPTASTAELTVAWTASDADGDPLQFTVQLSPAPGQPWQTLTVSSPESTLTVPTDSLPGGGEVRIRVIATDGVNSAIATSEPFALPRRSPEARITGIDDSAQLAFGTPVAVGGFGYDAEDGSLSAPALQWELSGPDARQGTGATVALPDLAPGSYQLQLRVTDSDGQTGTDVRSFTVRPLPVADGPEPRLDGLCADPGYDRTPAIGIRRTGGTRATVRLVHANGALYACFTGLPYSSANLPGSVAGLLIDPGASGQAVAATVGFGVDEHGEPVRLAGDGTRLVGVTTPPPGFTPVILRGENAWSAEIRIADALLGGWRSRLALLAWLDDGVATTPPATWPHRADVDRPDTWASGQAGDPAEEELIVNGSFENTADTFVPDGFKLMSLPTGASTVPGWTTFGSEIAWIGNTNSFGVETPHDSAFLDLTGYAGPFGGVKQTIKTIPGHGYRLSLALGALPSFPGGGGRKGVVVCIGDDGAYLHMTPPNDGGNYWEIVSRTFVAKSTSTEIAVVGALGGGTYLGLDRVSVKADDSVTPPTPGNLVVNGSFEQACGFVPRSDGVMSLPVESTAILGWTTTTAEIAWGANGNAYGPATQHDDLFLDLTGFHDSPPYGGIRQDLETVVGQRYRVTFALGANEANSFYSGPMSVAVTAGTSTVNFTFTPDPSQATNQWQTFAFDFTASTPVTPLALVGTATRGGSYLGLDNVVVIPWEGGDAEVDPLRIISVLQVENELRVTFKSESGRIYGLQRRTDLDAGDWESIPGLTKAGTGGLTDIVVTRPLTIGQEFFRLELRSP